MGAAASWAPSSVIVRLSIRVPGQPFLQGGVRLPGQATPHCRRMCTDWTHQRAPGSGAGLDLGTWKGTRPSPEPTWPRRRAVTPDYTHFLPGHTGCRGRYHGARQAWHSRSQLRPKPSDSSLPAADGRQGKAWGLCQPRRLVTPALPAAFPAPPLQFPHREVSGSCPWLQGGRLHSQTEPRQ